MIPQQTIEHIKSQALILDVVSEFVSLKRKGVNYVGLCPFHNDKSPSFYVSPAKNFCKCFACGAGGDPVSFLMKKENLQFYDAIRWLARKYNIPIEEREQSAEERQFQTDREGMFGVNEAAQSIFEHDLYETEEGRNIGLSYFRERGLTDETIKRFHLGYAIDNKYDLYNRIVAKGFDPKYLVDQTGVGLCFVVLKRNGEESHRKPMCRFAGRVIFPHHTLSGRCIAFAGRILARVDHAARKYVNSPESAVYHKSDLPYGLYEAKQDISRNDLCYVVEGNVDVLSMSQAGFTNVIAASGTALTREHIKIIKRFTRNMVLIFDSDKAGINAALKSIDLLLLEDMTVRLLLLPDGEDPDSFCRKNPPEVVADYFARNQVDFITFKARMLMSAIAPNDIIALGNVVQSVANSISLIPNPIMSGMLVRQLSQICNVPERNVLQAVNTGKQSNYQNEVRRLEAERIREQQLAEARERNELDNMFNPDQPDQQQPVTDPHVQPDQQQQPAVPQQQPVVPQQQPVQQPQQSLRPASPLDPFEQQLIRDIVRYGGQSFQIQGFDEAGNPVTQACRVIDFIYNSLIEDQIEFGHPLFAKMYAMALDASADMQKPWDSVRYFLDLYDEPEVQQMAINLLEDKYEGLGIVENEENLSSIVPRNVIELKNCIINEKLKELYNSLNMPGANYAAIMPEILKYQQAKKLFDKALGDRIITV